MTHSSVGEQGEVALGLPRCKAYLGVPRPDAPGRASLPGLPPSPAALP